MLATRAAWKEWLTASDTCKPLIPGKSYADVLKTDSQSQCMHSCAKNGVATQQRHPVGKLAVRGHIAPIKNPLLSVAEPRKGCRNVLINFYTYKLVVNLFLKRQ